MSKANLPHTAVMERERVCCAGNAGHGHEVIHDGAADPAEIIAALQRDEPGALCAFPDDGPARKRVFHGAGFLHAINSMRFPMIPAFATGGVVGDLGTTANNISVNVNPFGAESLGSLDLNVGGAKATRVYGNKSALAQLKDELRREQLRRGSGA